MLWGFEQGHSTLKLRCYQSTVRDQKGQGDCNSLSFIDRLCVFLTFEARVLMKQMPTSWLGYMRAMRFQQPLFMKYIMT